MVGLRMPFSTLAAGACVFALAGSTASAVDHFVTIGGGYDPKGNQASMEANVLFFKSLLADQCQPDQYQHHIFFSDGRDPQDDVQTAPSAEELSASQKLLAELFGWETQPISYRDHGIPDVEGSNRADEIGAAIQQLATSLNDRDRLFIYVTAHGGKSKKQNNPFETSIYGWERQSLTSAELANLLADVPASVPVVMVMAQCYCGGFSHAIFEQANAEKPLATGLRCGFFAQRHDLPAAGCRPDISNDREYSSYFWGALAGRSRSGNAIEGVDRDGDGKVSLAEAHIYAVVASETIDIPLRASDALLKVFSKAPSKKPESSKQTESPKQTESLGESQEDSELESTSESEPIAELCYLSGPIAPLLQQAEFVDAEIAASLMDELGFTSESTVEELQDRIAQSRPNRRGASGRGRSSMRGYRDSMGRLKDEILARWPEVEKVESLGECAKMGLSLEEIEEEISGWTAYQAYQEIVNSREAQVRDRQAAELQQVKLKRLLHTLETIALSKNLAKLAGPEIVQRYQAILKLERDFLTNL